MYRFSDGSRQNAGVRLGVLLPSLGLSAFLALTIFGFAAPAQAEHFKVSDIYAALQGQPQQQQQPAADSSYVDLANFVQSSANERPTTIGVTAPQASSKQADDKTISALRDFARNVGAGRQTSINDQPKLAEAQTLQELLFGGGSGSSAQAAAPKAAAPKRTSAPVEAHIIGSAACAKCHAPLIAEFHKTLMGKISMTPKGRGKFECENCHGPGSAHVAAGGGRGVGGILSFGDDDPRPVEERNAICLSCHQRGERTYWAGSIHQQRGLACTNCHTVMKNVSRKNNLKRNIVMETCFQCHKLKRAQIQYSSHMPINEGKLTCTDCHNPHGSITESLLREASVNDNCYKCHAEKRGPFLWEHEPVRENCLNCHVPHGSNYENLLKVARPRLCHECHSFAHGTGGFGTPTTAYVLGRACGNCHSNIHGSNHPNGMFFLR
jgi:DmsE family decaheme c-type cytochrome